MAKKIVKEKIPEKTVKKKIPKKRKKRIRKIVSTDKSKFKFEVVFKSKMTGERKFNWRIISCNGKPVVPTGMYLTPLGAKKVIKNFISAAKNNQITVSDDIVYET